MEKMIAYCGLVCTDCNAYIATQNDDDEMRKSTAAEWSEKYKTDIKPEDINCVGCTVATGPHIGHWGMCEIHRCGVERGVINCAYCDDYICEELGKYFEMAPVMKENMEEVRKGLNR